MKHAAFDLSGTEDAARTHHCVLEDLFAAHGTTRTVAANTTIASQGDRVSDVYRVKRGTLRACLYSKAGHRKILRFLLPGDTVALDGSPTHRACFEAVDTVVLEAVPAPVFTRLAHGNPAIQQAVLFELSRIIDGQAALLALTAQSGATDRVTVFLREFANRRRPGAFVSLPMGRRDIADHLGLSTETVSRSISALREAGEIELKGAAFFRFCDEADVRMLDDAA